DLGGAGRGWTAGLHDHAVDGPETSTSNRQPSPEGVDRHGCDGARGELGRLRPRWMREFHSVLLRSVLPRGDGCRRRTGRVIHGTVAGSGPDRTQVDCPQSGFPTSGRFRRTTKPMSVTSKEAPRGYADAVERGSLELGKKNGRFLVVAKALPYPPAD